MKKIIKNNYKIMIAFALGIIFSITTVYAVDAYIESNKVSYDNHNGKITKKNNVQDTIDELYERSGIHKDKWIDPELNGADPVLQEPLIPVEIKSNGDVYYASLNSEWYNYKEKRWANAVILIDNPSNTNYGVGDHIKEDDIESYFVWIPRYQYKVWDLGKYNTVIEASNLTNTQDNDTALWLLGGSNSRIIDIKFGTYETYPKMAEPTSVGVYYTHPAFTLGNKDLNGIWVGKFETGGTSEEDMVIKPDVISWRNETAKVFFDAARGYEKVLDSHMMKNIEWGATVYLSHSQYGISNDINVNNNSELKTGYSAAPSANQKKYPGETGTTNEPDKTQLYKTTVGYLASTTGNISGIYDMSGGAWECMAACIDGKPGNSGFDTDTLASEMASGYIDKYDKGSLVTSYNNRILGDATGELGPFYDYLEANGTSYYHNSWYGDYAYFLRPTSSWFNRGSTTRGGPLAGQLNFHENNGGGTDTLTFRLVLSPINS